MQFSQKPFMLLISGILFLTLHPTRGQDWLIELEKSEDLQNWHTIPIEPEIFQEGRLRVPAGEDAGFFRLRLVKPQDAAFQKLQTFVNASGINVPTPTALDYQDFGIVDLDLLALPYLNLAILDLDPQATDLNQTIHDLVNEWNAAPIDADVLAYFTRVGLPTNQFYRLNQFVAELKNESITPIWLCLGRSEFLAREGGTYRSVIGPDGTVAGTVADSPGGMGFSGESGNLINFPNPLPSATVNDFALFCHASSAVDVSSGRSTLVSAFGGTGNQGFELAFGGAPGLPTRLNEVAAYVSPLNSQTTNRHSVMPTVVPGIKKMGGFVFAGSDPAFAFGKPTDRPFSIHKDLHGLLATNTTTSFYNAGATWTAGARLGGGGELHGEIDLLIAFNSALSPALRDTLHSAALKHGIISTTNRIALAAVGDSMTAGQAGGVGLGVTRTAQLMGRQESGWKGGLYTNVALSGQNIDVQEGLYAEAKERLLRYQKSLDTFIMFWGGYNSTAPGDPDSAVRNALVERYIAMGIDARNNGIQTIHWSYLTGFNGSGLSEESRARFKSFNDYYTQRCGEEGFIWYDHRVTFSNGEFDGETRNENYFVDSRHLSELGQATLVADFINRFPTPETPFSAED